jgi:uncharacterized protein
VLKKASIVAAKKGMGTDGLTSLAMDAAGVAWEATEGADTRCWGLLPREIQIMRIEVPVGTRKIELHPLLNGRVIGPGHAVTLEAFEGQNSFVLANFPDNRLLGTVSVNTR